MKHQALQIELLEDCVFSARAATEGGHESLDRVPGTALLGAAAARCYRNLDAARAFAAFHSGRLRFGDGLPWNGRAVAWPVPLCWHHPKMEKPEGEGGRLDGERLFNLIVDGMPYRNGKRLQPKQLRNGYVREDGGYCKPAMGLRLKTAIEPTTGRAREAQLFGYQSLHRGQRFVAFIEADDDFDDELFRTVILALEGERLLGRSRSAEYGRVRISTVDAAPPPVAPAKENRTVLWLLSDLALADGDGQPVLEPTGAAFGLPDARVDWKRSFLRSRRFSPWNAARGGYDAEREVLQAGGVVVLESGEPPDEAVLQRLASGVGLYRAQGLGRVWVNPPLLQERNPRFYADGPVADQASSPPSRPDDPWLDWLASKTQGEWRMRIDDKARALAREYEDAVEKARRWAGVPEGEGSFAPSRSQWAAVGNVAQDLEGAALFSALFKAENAVVKPGGEGWEIEIPLPGGKQKVLAVWLRERLAPTAVEGLQAPRPDAAYALLVRKVADRVIGLIDRRGI